MDNVILKDLSDFNLDGKQALKELISNSHYKTVEQAIASLTIFTHPALVKQTRNKNIFNIIRYKNGRTSRGQFIDLPDGRRAMYDDNKGPTDAFLWANSINRNDYEDVVFGHVWDRSDNVDYYTSLANICMLPAFLSKLTDTDRSIKELLRYHVFNIYEGFRPDSESELSKPRNYDSLLWAKQFETIKDLEKRFRERMKIGLKDRTVKSAREIGWYFSNYQPDSKLSVHISIVGIREKNGRKLMGESKDYSRYDFAGQEYNKGRLVHAVVKQYINNNPDTDFAMLERAFPKKLQGSRYGVFDTLDNAKEIETSSNQARHFLKDKDILTLKGGIRIAICTQWGADVNIEKFLVRAKELRNELGFEIRKIS